jgi:hypothetical protein
MGAQGAEQSQPFGQWIEAAHLTCSRSAATCSTNASEPGRFALPAIAAPRDVIVAHTLRGGLHRRQARGLLTR